ncbi:MAG TPA: XTP/dITP diphosphatase [Elusimicrobiota bacterium]|nr:XTP/dITP diphosphatase [Elusimicrobiota bacterium]
MARARLLVATRNEHKVQEIRSILAGVAVELATLKEFPGVPEVVEDGATLEDNARKKAVETAKASGLWSLADDTGLEVAALDGAPGVRSARYAGEGCSYDDNNRKLLAALAGVPAAGRGAAFRCVIALASPDGKVRLAQGRLDGRIAEERSGAGGFGYDPLFFVPEFGRTLADLTPAQKNAASHRARALAAARPMIEELFR